MPREISFAMQEMIRIYSKSLGLGSADCIASYISAHHKE